MCTQGKRGNRDLQLLQDCFRKANEMEAVFIPEISSTNSHFATIRQKTDEVTRLCGEILSGERDDLVQGVVWVCLCLVAS